MIILKEYIKEKNIEDRINEIKQELYYYSKENDLKGLEDCIRRGLYVTGIMALKELRVLVEELCMKLGAKVRGNSVNSGVEDIILKVHKSGPWYLSDKLREFDYSPEIKVWKILNIVIFLDRDKSRDLTKKQFLEHLDNIKILLKQAINSPDKFLEDYWDYAVWKSYENMRKVNGIPIAEGGLGFIPIILQDYESGIIQDENGNIFIGSKNDINPEIFIKWGLKMRIEDDERGHKNIKAFYNNKGQRLLRQLYPGFLVVDSKDFELATEIIRAIELVNQGVAIEDLEVPNDEVLGNYKYIPTSFYPEEVDNLFKYYFLRQREFLLTKHSNKRDMIPMRELFFDGISWIKGHIIFLDAVRFANQKRRLKSKPLLNDQEKYKLAKKILKKSRQKVEELRYLSRVVIPSLNSLPKEVNKVIDMAGGVGDFGLLVGVELFTLGHKLDEIIIVDPFSKVGLFDEFCKMVLDYIPFGKELKDILVHSDKTIQEYEIDDNSIVIAKHPCGDLADWIIEKWINSKSPLLVIMTCCQDKACGKPARYGLSQVEWDTLCRQSAMTNIVLPEPGSTNYTKLKNKLERGIESMYKLDSARLHFLQSMGFDATLFTNKKFPKGNVIIAKRK